VQLSRTAVVVVTCAAAIGIAHVPLPGADLNALQRVFQTNQLAGFFDFSDASPTRSAVAFGIGDQGAS
jgi:hypothetical protein